MSYNFDTDIVPHLTFYSLSANHQLALYNTMKALYEGSATARSLFDLLVTENKQLGVQYEANNMGQVFHGSTASPIIRIDPQLYIDDQVNLINQHGTVVSASLDRVIAHELTHAVTPKGDPTAANLEAGNYSTSDELRGETVDSENTIMAEMGETDTRISYFAWDKQHSTTLNQGFEYTSGQSIDSATYGGITLNLSNFSENVLMFAYTSSLTPNQNFTSGSGNDFLWGWNGNDILKGNGGNDVLQGGADEDTAVFSGNFADYKFTKVSDTEWTVEHRNGGADGTDTLIDMEKAQFADKTVSLKGGTDLVIAIDISGSMGDDIDAVQNSSQAVLDAIFNGDNGSVDNRVGILTFNDTGDISGITNFTDQDGIDDRKAAAASGISSVMLSDGGEEPLNGALLYALEGGLGAWREDADTRRIVVFSDEPPADPELASQVQQAALNPAVGISSSVLLYSSSAMSVTQTLAASGNTYVEIFTVAIGNDPAAISALAQIATDNNGQAFLAANASELVAALVAAISAPPSEPEPELILIEGTNGYDLIYGGDDAEEIFAYDGNDDVYAGKGNDILHGGNGHDFLVGDEGDDLIYGDAGNDELFGAEGNDTIEGGAGYDILAGEDGNDQLFGGTEEDELFGEAGNDTLDGGAHDDYLEGGSGNDSMLGGDGDDILYGQEDNDTLDGGNGNDYLHGGTGADVLRGGAGNDDLYGADGNDILISGTGDDYLEGGAGSDTFRFESFSDSSMTDGIDYIGDFTQGVDKIDLSGLGFIDVSNFQVYNDGSYTEIYDNATGFALGFDGSYSLQNSDFIF